MASRAIYPTNKEVSCPVCAKTMLLKNWKDHCQTKHTMILSEENLQKEYDKLKKVAASSAKSFKPATDALPISSLFSTKNFSLTKHTPSTVVNDNNDVSSSNSHDNSVSISPIQDLDNNPITAVSSSTDHQTMLTIQTECLDTEMIESEPNNGDVGLLTPAEVNVLRTVDTTEMLIPRTAEQVHYDNCSDATSDSEIESDNNTIECTFSSSNHSELYTAGNKNPNRPILMLKSIPGVIFINSEEFTFVDKQRLAHPDIKWYPVSVDKYQKHKSYHKPSAQWFTRKRPWLRAVCSVGRYELLCTDCSEFGSNSMNITRDGGAFIARPFWKLKHKGIEGIREHESSEFHRSSRERRIISNNIRDRGDIVGQLNCGSLREQTEKYLSILLQVFWYILTEELVLNKFKPLIQLLNRAQCPGVVEWLNLSNNKQKYWGHEAVSEWLLSINNYIYQQQLGSIRKADFISLIVDETQDISVHKMASICLRYVEKDTGTIQEQLFKIEPIKDTSGEGYFLLIEKFLNQLERDAGKRFIITGQTYDGVSSMRHQTTGHVKSRLSAWGFYIYCRSHLLNLAVKESGEKCFSDSFDTLKSALSFIRDSPQRLEILFNSQKLNKTSKKGHTVPKASKTRWSYNYEILRFAAKHYLPIIQALTTFSQLKVDGSSDAKRYAFVLLKQESVFEIIMLKNIFKISMKFLRQIESRGSCLDSFSLHVQAAIASISKVAQDFDFQLFKSLMGNLQQYVPTITSTAHSTRCRRKEISTTTLSENLNEDELRNDGEEIVATVLTSLANKFDKEAKDLIESLTTLSTPSKLSPDQLLQNHLINTYTNEISYEHTSVDKRKFKRTDSPLLNVHRLKDDVHAFLVLTKYLNSIQSILQHLAIHGQEQAPEWYKLYQILATFPIGSNEAERSFSTLRRIKSWQRNRISDSALEICIKVSTLAPCLTDEAIQFIVRDFVSHPGRAKSRNITISMGNSDEEQNDSDDD